MKKNDIILTITLLIIAMLFYVAVNYIFVEQGSLVKVTVKGEEFGVYSLDKDQVIAINHTNTLVIEEGEAHMKEANCPDGICVKHNPIRNLKEMIVCLPNQIVVEVITNGETNDKSEEIDAIIQ